MIDTLVTIAYECSLCGSFIFINKSVFDLMGNPLKLECSNCKGNTFSTSLRKKRKLYISASCIGCGQTHVSELSVSGIIKKDLTVLTCVNTGIHYCFIGKDDKVRAEMDIIEKEMDKLIDTFGYECYFNNSRVMLDSLNKIHDIAEKGNLFCTCGNNDIHIQLFPDCIVLKCRKCNRENIVKASSNEDLKDILLKQVMFLS